MIGNGREAIFVLGCSTGPVSLRENFGFAWRELNEIARELNQCVGFLCEQSRNIHGEP